MPECDICHKTKLLTYRSKMLGLRSVCAWCIRTFFPETLRTSPPRHRRTNP